MSRHFLAIGGRLVHYRRWGDGPAVLLLHGSPQSSRAVAGIARALAARGLCAIAPDTPGNGLSTPLPGQPDCGDYADALAAFADALGLGRFGLYGFHTGAAIACVFAARHPERVRAIAFNGLSCWTDAESLALPRTYLTPFQPVWDGSHMCWAWARIEEQAVFFPWCERTPRARMAVDVSPLPSLQANVMDLLDSGDSYRAPYAAAFGFRTETWFPQVGAPSLLAVSEADPLRPHLARSPLSDADHRVFADPADLAEAAASLLAAHPGDPAPPPADGQDRGFTKGIAWYGRPNGTGRPLVLLHDAGGSARLFAPILAAIAASRPVLALDLPGHGESSEGVPAPEGVAGFAQGVASAVTGLGLDRPAIAGYGFGGLVAAALAADGIADAATFLGKPAAPALDPVALAAPSLSPEWDGAHLLRAFRIARWERLFAPWYRRDRHHAIVQGSLDPNDVQARALELLKANDAWTAAVACALGARIGLPGIALCASADPADWILPLAGYSR